MSSQGGRGGGQKFPILLSKKTTKRGGGGQKLPILRQHSLWTSPKENKYINIQSTIYILSLLAPTIKIAGIF